MKTYSNNFIKFLMPGFLMPEETPLIPLRQPLTYPFTPEPHLIPENCDGYAIYSQEMVWGHEGFHKKPELISKVFFGEIWDVNRVIKEHGKKSMLAKELLDNNIEFVVKTLGGFYINLHDGDHIKTSDGSYVIEHKAITKIIYEKS